jgi:citrate synthase
LLAVARNNSLDGPHVQLLLKLSAMIDEAAGKHITINATGALAALLLEIGISPNIVRAIAVVSRSAGLVGHILEEQKTKSSRLIINKTREAIPYADPTE